MTSGAYGARSPLSHYDGILIVTSFATELATPTVTDVRYVRTDTLHRLIYKDVWITQLDRESIPQTSSGGPQNPVAVTA